jgi:ectoine hydroxylase-related dioxygenase (phytanoyl-CoA dioxygenase family)
MAMQATTQTAEEIRAFYDENGYVIIEDAFRPDEIEAIRRETVAICRGDAGTILGHTPPPRSDSDDEVIARYLCIHHPHKISQLMLDTMSHPAIVDVLTTIIGPNVKTMQSMLFIKSAGKPGQAWHQDENFIPTRDRSLCGGWIALDDATTENGCLWVIPGSHRAGVLWPTRETKDDRFDCADEAVGFPYTEADEVPVEVATGSIVFFNGYLLHRSLPNTAKAGYRRALVNHYMSAESLLCYGHDFGYARHDYRDIVLVAGTDPYGYKGSEHKVSPQVRPEKFGGCAWIDESEIEAPDDHA